MGAQVFLVDAAEERAQEFGGEGVPRSLGNLRVALRDYLLDEREPRGGNLAEHR